MSFPSKGQMRDLRIQLVPQQIQAAVLSGNRERKIAAKMRISRADMNFIVDTVNAEGWHCSASGQEMSNGFMAWTVEFDDGDVLEKPFRKADERIDEVRKWMAVELRRIRTRYVGLVMAGDLPARLDTEVRNLQMEVDARLPFRYHCHVNRRANATGLDSYEFLLRPDQGFGGDVPLVNDDDDDDGEHNDAG